MTSVSVKFDADSLGNLTQNNATGTITIAYTTSGSLTGFTPQAYAGPLIIPGTLGGVTVTSIDVRVFLSCTSLTSITIPASVTSIGLEVFSYCSSLTSITFGSGSQLTSFGIGVFNNCIKLKSIIIPASVTSVGNYVFGGCSDLATVTFASGSQLSYIGRGMFTNCFKLTSIIIPASVTSIDYGAFEGTSLTSITIPALVTSIGEIAFRSCTSLTSITIPASVTSIGNDAFRSCTSLATVTFLGNVPTLGASAFTDISSSANAYYISNTNNINLAQYFSTRVTQMVFTYTASGSNATITGFTSKTYAGSLVTPITLGGVPVTSIGENAFRSYTGLTSITIPASVTSIGHTAFMMCSNLSSIKFASDSRLLTIGIAAFESCTSLKSITIPASVTSIGDNAFNSSSLTTMYVSTPNGLGLTPGTSVTRYGKSFTVIDIAAAAAPPSIPICFLAGTTVTTDQGDIAIEKLSPYFYTIHGKKIVSVVTVHPLQKLMYKGKMVSAIDLVEGYQGPTTPQSHLYLVRLRDSRKGRR